MARSALGGAMPRSWAGIAGCAVAAAALLVFTAVTVHTRDSNTRAVLLRMQSIDVPPAPKLSYSGPLYTGGGQWQLHGKTIETSVAKAKAESAAAKVKVHTAHAAKKALKTAQHEYKPSGWEKAAPGLAADVRTAEELVRSGKKHLSDINDGFEKAFDVHDARVHMKKPVKVLTHV